MVSSSSNGAWLTLGAVLAVTAARAVRRRGSSVWWWQLESGDFVRGRPSWGLGRVLSDPRSVPSEQGEVHEILVRWKDGTESWHYVEDLHPASQQQGSAALPRGVRRVKQDQQTIELWTLLGWLKGFKEYAQQAHWRSSGESFYGDHLLLERLYSGDLDEHIDALGEQITMLVGPDFINAPSMADEIHKAINYMDDTGEGDLEGLLVGIVVVQAKLASLIEQMAVMPGLQDLLASIANTFDTFRYLLMQRLDGV